MVDPARRKAVADTMGLKWRGTPAFILARTYHPAMMPGLGRRARLLTDWNVGLLFGRDLAELGQLGHVPALGGAPLGAQSAGGTGAEGRAVAAGAETHQSGRPAPYTGSR